jgi:putative two-component system response regulator
MDKITAASDSENLSEENKSPAELESVEELYELEDIQETDGTEPFKGEPPEENIFSNFDPDMNPVLRTLVRTFSNFPFPAVILSPRLYILWENPRYREICTREEHRLPVNIAQDFPNSIDTAELGKIYKALREAETNYSYRLRIESIHHQRLTRVFNVNIFPIYLNGDSRQNGDSPHRYYQAFFDDVTREQRYLIHTTFLSLLEASRLKDNDTGKHIQRVGGYSRILAEYLYQQGFNKDALTVITPEFIENIQFLAQMHDVGKIGTPDDILNKEGALDDREWEIMREHTINGAYIMSTYPHPMAREIALFHHEKWDGSGYPYQLSEEMIPLSARIVAVADVYDALRMERSYKQAFDHEQAVSLILEGAGSHFDPTLIHAFAHIHPQFEALYEELKDS